VRRRVRREENADDGTGSVRGRFPRLALREREGGRVQWEEDEVTQTER
jgi:hypothetical protein